MNEVAERKYFISIEHKRCNRKRGGGKEGGVGWNNCHTGESLLCDAWICMRYFSFFKCRGS